MLARKNAELSTAELLLQEALQMTHKGSLVEEEARTELGKMLEEQGLYERALEALSLGADPQDSVAERRLGLLLRLGRLPEAVELVHMLRASGAELPKCSNEAQRLVALGLVSPLKTEDSTTQKMSLVPVQWRFLAGDIYGALENSGPEGLELGARAARLRVQGRRLRGLGEVLSNKTLARQLADSGTAASDGRLELVLARLLENVHEGSDWRTLLWGARICGSKELQGRLLAGAARACEGAQRWRVWLEASELRDEGDEGAVLLARAHREAPARHRVAVLAMAASRGSADERIEVLRKSWRESNGHWRAGMALAHALGSAEEGEDVLKQALSASPGSGRLWAAWARRLEARPSDAEAVTGAGLRLVPRAGELWSERGRALARRGSWTEAAQSFSHALVFTPQYGDVFLEMARASLWRLITRRCGLAAQRGHVELTSIFAQWDTSEVEHLVVLSNPNHGSLWDVHALELGWGALPIEIFAWHKLDLMQRLRDCDGMSSELVRDILFRPFE